MFVVNENYSHCWGCDGDYIAVISLKIQFYLCAVSGYRLAKTFNVKSVKMAIFDLILLRFAKKKL